MSEFLKYENIYLHYDRKLVLKNISGSLETGTLYVLKGENGAGKTSLINILCGKIAPNRGEVRGLKFNRNNIKAMSGASYLYSHLSVRENLEIFSNTDAVDSIEKFRLQDYANVLVRDLSQGYVQRLNLSIVLCSEADVMIIDEPTNFLDRASKDFLLEELKDCLGRGKAILVSTHEPEYFTPLEPSYLNLREGEYE